MATVFAIHANAVTHLTVSRAVAALDEAELVGRTTSAVEAQRVFETLAPDAVTVDLSLPDGNGIMLAHVLRAGRGDLPVLLVGPMTHRLLKRAVSAGVAAYLPRSAGVPEVSAALRACLSGNGSFSAHTLNALLRESRPTGLSRREQQVYDLLQGGCSPVEVAARLRLGESTVRTYVARVRAKTAAGGDMPQVG
jgi:DNA-binding NarL/FixJ family response regulator